MSGVLSKRVHAHLYATWGDQSCQRPSDWPDVFARFMASAKASDLSSPSSHGRGSLRPMFNEAVAALTEAFNADVPPADPAEAVWRIFPRLDREHCQQLADLLMRERANG
jgi:hypothetical protein